MACSVDWAEIYYALKDRSNEDPESCIEAYTALGQKVRPWALARLSDCRWLLDDLIADTQAAVLDRISSAYGPESFGGFVWYQFKTQFRHYLRVCKAEGGNGGDDPPDVPSADPELVDDQLLDCLERLNDVDRTAVALRHIYEVPDSELAMRLTELTGRHISDGNARVILFRAMEKLRACFRES